MLAVVTLLAALPLSFGSEPTLQPLRVRGAHVYTADGQKIRLRGVNAACMEWSSDGEGHLMETLKVAVKDWKSNIVRLPLSQDRWFGKAPEQKDDGASYRSLVQDAVKYCTTNGAYIMLDLHWNNAGVWGHNIGQHVMPDMNSVAFWKSCAREYRGHPGVLFDLYNEPHDTTWDIWLKGGEITETRGVGARQGRFTPVAYRTPGMQKLLDTVRSMGADNVVVAGGLDWSYDLSGFMKGYDLKDPDGRGVIYACHSYPFKGDTVEKFLTKLDAALPHFPVIVSEFGSNNPRATADKPNEWVQAVVTALEERKCHWTAWDLHPAAGPTLISDWKYTPTPSFGVIVKGALAKR